MRRDARRAIQQPRSVAAAITGCLASASAAQTDAEMTMCGTKTQLSCLDDAAKNHYSTHSRQECLTDNAKWRMSGERRSRVRPGFPSRVLRAT